MAEPEVVVFVKGVDVTAAGVIRVTYDAKRSAGGSVTGRVLSINFPPNSAADTNDAVLRDAKQQVGAGESDHVSLWGGVAQELGMPGQ